MVCGGLPQSEPRNAEILKICEYSANNMLAPMATLTDFFTDFLWIRHFLFFIFFRQINETDKG